MLKHLMNGEAARPSRRQFLIGAAAVAGGLVVGGRAQAEGAVAGAKTPVPPFEAYIRIAPDNTVTVLSSQFDMGQGSYHGVATLVVEELGASWKQIAVEGAAGDPKYYGNLTWGGTAQGTGGSSSMATSFDRYRMAGAAAREMLKDAAASKWKVPAAEITVKNGKLTHASGKSATFGDMAGAAAQLPVPANVKLKPRKSWSQIGNAKLRRYDSAAKAKGQHPFPLDLKLPGMLTAAMIHPPKFGATVKSFDGTAAKAMPGVVDVVAVPRGVAIVAQHTWAAFAARDAVTVEWDFEKAETRGSEQLLAEYKTLADGAPQAVARSDGDAAGGLDKAAKVIEATYTFPYLAHAAMEPLNAAARMNADGTLDVWGGHQIPGLYRHIAATIAGVDPAKVVMHVMKTGGGFGRRAVPDGDLIAEAVSIAKAIGFKAPVKVQWTRENDMRGGRYRPAYVHKIKAGLDKDGNIVAWQQHIVGQSIVKGSPFQGMIKNGVDPTSVEGASTLPYAIPNLSVGLTTTEVGVPVLWWRSVGSTHTAFSTETFLDQLAAASGTDPLALRLSLLKDHPRHAGVLKLAAEKAGWGKKLPDGHFQGLAVHESFSSYVAQVVEISMDGDTPKVHRVVCAVDCGTAINPDTIKAQIEGGIGFGLGAALAERIDLVDGEVQQGNFDGYQPLRIDQMPMVDVYIVPSDAPPTGVGEPGVPPIAPAVVNAMLKATGKPVTALPIVS